MLEQEARSLISELTTTTTSNSSVNKKYPTTTNHKLKSNKDANHTLLDNQSNVSKSANVTHASATNNKPISSTSSTSLLSESGDSLKNKTLQQQQQKPINPLMYSFVTFEGNSNYNTINFEYLEFLLTYVRVIR